MKRKTLIDLRQAYAEGRNITALLREEMDSEFNTIEAIELAYDLQTGSYIAALDRPEFAAYLDAYSKELATRIADLDVGGSILDVGCGEGTTFAEMIVKNDWADKDLGAFDLSWSRASYAREYLKRQGANVTLFVADIGDIPLPANSVDTIVSSHALEPNGGREKELLSELYRICARYLVLLEPSDELGGEDTRGRMLLNGYIRDLRRNAEELGLEVVRHELMDNCANPQNRTALLVIRKGGTAMGTPFTFSTPGADALLVQSSVADGGFWYSPEEGLAFPQIAGIPCLRRIQAIPASKYGTPPFG